MTTNTKVSFSVSKNSSKPVFKSSHNITNDENQQTREFVTEYDPNKTLEPKPKPAQIIPPKTTESRIYKKMKNLELPMSESNNRSDQLQFDLEKKSDADDADKVSYGLNLRSNGNNNSQDAVGPTIDPVENVLLKDFKSDLERLPDDGGFEEFEDRPIEGFGAALLSGFGWNEGRGIGKNPKGDVIFKQVEKKSFAAADDGNAKPPTFDKPAGVNLGERDSISVGKDVRVIGGKHMGSKEDKSFKELRTSQKGEIDKQAKYQESQKLVGKRSRGREKADGSYDSNRVLWLRSHIRVRIISKEFKKGRLYLKKGEVVDVVGPATCDISMDESGELIQGVHQEHLETALPRRGGAVLVLYGKHKGVYGNLMEKDSDRETGVVQDADTHDLLNVKLEQIAEYIGDPSYIGY